MIGALIATLAALALAAPTETGRDGPFAAVVLAVPDLDQLGREWAVPTAGARITNTSRLMRGSPTFIAVMVAGCQRDQRSLCHLEIRHRLTGPDGKVYDGLDGTRSVPSDIAIANATDLHISDKFLGVQIDPGEALGPYELTVTVTDSASRRKVVTRQTLMAVDRE